MPVLLSDRGRAPARAASKPPNGPTPRTRTRHRVKEQNRTLQQNRYFVNFSMFGTEVMEHQTNWRTSVAKTKAECLGQLQCFARCILLRGKSNPVRDLSQVRRIQLKRNPQKHHAALVARCPNPNVPCVRAGRCSVADAMRNLGHDVAIQTQRSSVQTLRRFRLQLAGDLESV